MEVTHLVTNGCSFTFGDELEDPKTQAWPALLAKRLGLPIVNLALPGTGNDCILRRTTEYLYENASTNSKPLVIIGWSQDWRREEWFVDECYASKNYNNYSIVSLPDSTPQNYYEYAMLENYSHEDIYRRTLQRKVAMKHLLTSFKLPYIISNFAFNQYEDELIDRMKNRFSTMVGTVDEDPYKIIDMFSHVQDYPKCPGGHDGPEAQEAIAACMQQKIHELHGEITPTKKPFLTLRDFMRHEQYVKNWFHWVDVI